MTESDNVISLDFKRYIYHLFENEEFYMEVAHQYTQQVANRGGSKVDMALILGHILVAKEIVPIEVRGEPDGGER